MIKACLFDLDGTLLDTLGTIRYYLNKTLSKYGLRNVNLDETKVFVGKGARRLIVNALEAAGVDIDAEEGAKLLEAVLNEYVSDYDKEPEYMTEPYDGMRETVSELKELGIKLAVISNKPDKTVKKLTAYNFGDKFEIVEGATERMPLKPDPTWALDICRRLGVTPDEVMYLGDTSTDMQTAKNFGAAIAVGVLWGFRDKGELLENGADTIVASPLEIPRLVKQIYDRQKTH